MSNPYLALLRGQRVGTHEKGAAPKGIAAPDAERAEYDRLRRFGYDYDPAAPSHAEFLEAIQDDFDIAIAQINQLNLPMDRLADAHAIFSAYTASFDRCFEARRWAELRLSFTRLVAELRSLC